jgi:hypothetical protein
MGRIYHYGYTGTFTAAGGNTDLLSIQPADDKPIKLRYFMISQVSEFGDAAEEAIQISVHRMPATFTVGSGGSALTAARGDRGGTAAAATVRANDTTVATTSGTDEFFGYFGWNVRGAGESPGVWMTDPFSPSAAQTDGLVIRADSTPADDITINLYAIIEEEG